MRKMTYYMTDKVFFGLRNWQRGWETRTGEWPNQQRAINTLLQATLEGLGHIEMEYEEEDSETQKLEVLTFLAKCTGDKKEV